MKRIIIATAFALALGLAAQTQAITIPFVISLDGLQEVPPNASTASGFGTASYDTVTGELTLHVEFSGLLAEQTAAHIHSAAPGVNGPVIIPLSPPLPLGSPIDFSGPFPAAEEANLLAGNTYVNVHSTLLPGGEIRGQILQVPDSGGTMLLLIGSSLGILWARRRI